MNLSKKRRLRELRAAEDRHMADLAATPSEEQLAEMLRSHYGWTDAAEIQKAATVLRDFYVRWSTPRPRHGLHAANLAALKGTK